MCTLENALARHDARGRQASIRRGLRLKEQRCPARMRSGAAAERPRRASRRRAWRCLGRSERSVYTGWPAWKAGAFAAPAAWPVRSDYGREHGVAQPRSARAPTFCGSSGGARPCRGCNGQPVACGLFTAAVRPVRTTTAEGAERRSRGAPERWRSFATKAARTWAAGVLAAGGRESARWLRFILTALQCR